MNTMADGAAQRLVAQIGEALFGQPGMDLSEIANSLRIARGSGSPLLCATCYGVGMIGGPSFYAPDEGGDPCPDCAQPSPAGQGDVRAQFESWAHAQSYRGGNIITDRDADHPDVYACPNARLTWQCWKAALAARQPVGQDPLVWSDRAKAHALEAGQFGFTEADGQDLGYTACIEACVDAICNVLALPEHRAAPPAQAVEMSPEFTDTARAAIAWVLWHHQGGSSPVGQPLRFALGMGQHDRLTDHQVAEAKRFAAFAGATTEGFHRHKAAQAVDPADPWRGLYSPDLMPKLDGVNLYFVAHPDLPSWPKDEDEERGIGPLVTAQGFAIEVVFGEYPGDDGEEVDYCAWLANWTPDAPAGADWRLACIQDTEDGPAAFYVRPLALIDSKAVGNG